MDEHPIDRGVTSVKRTGELLDRSQPYVRRVIKDGRLKAVRDGKTLKVVMASVLAYLRNLEPQQRQPGRQGLDGARGETNMRIYRV